LDILGQTHTEEGVMLNCNTCGSELTDDNWVTSWKKVNVKCTCNKEHRKKSNPKSNPNRMWVNGKYISKKHPLFTTGTIQDV
jgi:hypothetical protein